MDSILISIKKLLGPSEELTYYDADIIMHINTVLMALRQMGVGPTTPFYIVDDSQTWSDFLGEDIKNLEAVKTYIYIKVKLVFDSSALSAVSVQAMNETAKEIEYRLISAVEYPDIM